MTLATWVLEVVVKTTLANTLEIVGGMGVVRRVCMVAVCLVVGV